MATVTATPVSAPAETIGDQRVAFSGIGWHGYQTLLKVQGEKSRPQMVYLDGIAYLVSPSNIHERLGKRLGMFVMIVVEELDIPCEATGETTFHRHDVDAGVQPGESFYLANYRSIAVKDGKEYIDLDMDPPPDLAIEVVHTHPATHAVEVLRRLGVPEVWVCNRDGLCILVRKKNGRYVEAKKSQNFPFLTAAEIFDWVARPGMASTTQWIRELRRWVQDVLVPRVQGQGG